MPRDELSRTSPLLLLYLQVTLFVYSDLLLFTKEDEPGRCNVLRNPLYLHSVKLQEGECLQQRLGGILGVFWLLPERFLASSRRAPRCPGASSASKWSFQVILPGVQGQIHPCYSCIKLAAPSPGTLRSTQAFSRLFGSQDLGCHSPGSVPLAGVRL